MVFDMILTFLWSVLTACAEEIPFGEPVQSVVPIMLIASLAASAIGSGMSAAKNAKARREEKRNYNEQQGLLAYQQFRSPLDSISNRAIFKTMDERLKENTEAIENQAAAGGATTENVLAAKQKNNQIISNVGTNLLQAEEARQNRIQNQQMALNEQHSNAVQQGYRADAQNWKDWGQSTSQALMSYGMTNYLGGSSALASGSASANHVPLQSASDNTNLTSLGNSMNGFGGPVPAVTLRPRKQ
jgi:hypothetical protein